MTFANLMDIPTLLLALSQNLIARNQKALCFSECKGSCPCVFGMGTWMPQDLWGGQRTISGVSPHLTPYLSQSGLLFTTVYAKLTCQ